MEPVQIPTIGRIVHYRAAVDEEEPVRPAIVVAVSDGAPTLAVFDVSGLVMHASPSQHGQQADGTPQRGCWSWPPRA